MMSNPAGFCNFDRDDDSWLSRFSWLSSSQDSLPGCSRLRREVKK